jgi:hypothetical protein
MADLLRVKMKEPIFFFSVFLHIRFPDCDARDAWTFQSREASNQPDARESTMKLLLWRAESMIGLERRIGLPGTVRRARTKR